MSRSSSRRLLVTAVAATSVALLASACGKSSGQPSAGPAATSSASSAPGASASSPAAAPAGPQYAAGTPMVSDGTATVTIGGAPVTFPTAVSEAAWSQTGNRIVFIDGSGNVATARPDGSDVVVLVKPAQGSKLSSPAWEGGTVLYTELTAAGTHSVRQAHFVGQADHTEFDLYTLVAANNGQTMKNIADTSNPGGMVRRQVGNSVTTMAFQAAGAKGPEVWVHVYDSNSRGGVNPAQDIGAGSWPAVSTSGEVAFVGSGGGIEVVAVKGNTKPAPQKIADGGADANHLAWTPDGKTVAYSTPGGIMEASVGQPGAAPTQLSAKPGVVSFLPSATVQVVPLSGNSPTDLTGASVAISQRMWLTQNGTTPAPAGGGPRGAYGMSATIIAANDVATAQKELNWAGLYGPTLLSTGAGQSGALDPRLLAEVKRVLGKPNTQSTFDGVAAVYLVGAADAFPSSADAAITALGYKPVHVTSAPKGGPAASPRPTIAIVDPSDSAALSEAKAEGAHVLQLSGGRLAAADADYLTGQDKGYQSPEPQIIAFGDQAFAAVTAMKFQRLGTPTEALGATHADFLAATALNPMTNTLVVAPTDAPADVLLAAIDTYRVNSAAITTATVTLDPAQGISPTLKALLETRGADISELDVLDTDAKLPANLLKQLETLAAGPLGAQTAANQTADALAKAEGGAGTN